MTTSRNVFENVVHRPDFCVVGGGMAGMCAALSAARHGASVVLMHDRPVLGGNASSECRVHICGADRNNGIKNMRETGILEELRLENLHRNPNRNFSVWDTILYEKIAFEPNITLLLNCSCLDARMDGARIESVTGWQLTTQTYHTVHAPVFADCSGDAVLAPLTGADARMGREARSEYGESIAPEHADARTMGMTCLFQTRQYNEAQPFRPPDWAHRYDACDQLPYGAAGHTWWQMGYWWVELGGEHHSVNDTEALRDELLKIAYGVWDHIKNRCPQRDVAGNWALDWLQFLPAKRESRRYLGDHVLTQGDIETAGHFRDLVAYGGWTMDDHHPAGFNAVRIGVPATCFHPAPSPYGIPYRCLYSRNVPNLVFAGRDASCTHAAMSSTRVMGTGCSMGQAVGTAGALAVRHGLTPREVGGHVDELQQLLLADDCYLPWVPRDVGELTRSAILEASTGDPEPMRDGIDRPVGNDAHCWTCRPGDHVAYRFGGPREVNVVTLVLDSALEKNPAMSYHHDDVRITRLPDVLPVAFRIEGLTGDQWRPLHWVWDNHQRFVRLALHTEAEAVRFVLEKTRGSESTRVYAFYVD